MGRTRELKEIIVELELDLVRATIPQGHCPYSYYRPTTIRNDCGEIECGACRRRFMGDMEVDIRKKVKKM